MNASFLQSLLLAWALMALVMKVVFVVGEKIRNAGIVDVVWAFGFLPVTGLYVLLSPGYFPRQMLFLGLVALWSVRLGVHLARRVASHHPVEDSRYRKLREDWGAAAGRKMFGFFQLQGALLTFLTIPFLLICRNDEPTLHPAEWAGAILWLAACIGEAVADAQLAHFKRTTTDRKAVCQVGLWNYSRHPNYFFEWLVWVALFVFALGSPLGCTSLYAPALMLHFLRKVTGIPMTEALAVQTKGAAYLEYQRTTSAFVPWFKKKPSAASSHAD